VTPMSTRVSICDFSVLSGRGECTDGSAPSLSQQHDLSSLPHFGLTHLKTSSLQAKKYRHQLSANSPKAFPDPQGAIDHRHAATIAPDSV
jgi:hypothetical protein